jgi:hypothetical protein
MLTIALSVVGGIIANKYACIWLHKQLPSPARDMALRVLNGGPGPLPK